MGVADVRAGTQKYCDLLSTRPNISESYSEICTRVPFCIAAGSKTTSTPIVVLDATGLGRGHAFVNGFDIGMFWPLVPIAKGGFGASQTYYHVPPDCLRPGGSNELVVRWFLTLNILPWDGGGGQNILQHAVISHKTSFLY